MLENILQCTLKIKSKENIIVLINKTQREVKSYKFVKTYLMTSLIY